VTASFASQIDEDTTVLRKDAHWAPKPGNAAAFGGQFCVAVAGGRPGGVANVGASVLRGLL